MASDKTSKKNDEPETDDDERDEDELDEEEEGEDEGNGDDDGDDDDDDDGDSDDGDSDDDDGDDEPETDDGDGDDDDDDDDDSDDDDDDDDGDDDDDDSDDDDDDDDDDQAAAEPAKGGSLGKSLFLFIIVVGGLAAGFWVLGGSDGAGTRHNPKWKVGETVDVEITLVASDSFDLGCAHASDIKGNKCEFDGNKKALEAKVEEAKMLKPYTSTSGIQLAAAGLWSQPALEKSKLPKMNERFSVKCKYTIDGKLKAPAIRWHKRDNWIEDGNDWYAGAVKDCTMNP